MEVADLSTKRNKKSTSNTGTTLPINGSRLHEICTADVCKTCGWWEGTAVDDGKESRERSRSQDVSSCTDSILTVNIWIKRTSTENQTCICTVVPAVFESKVVV